MSDDPQRASENRAYAAKKPAVSRPRPVVAGWIACGCVMATTVVAGQAGAADAEVTSDGAAQMYDVRSPTGEVVLARQRFDATVGVNAYNLTDAPMNDTRAAIVSLRVRLRYGSDFGLSSATFDPSQTNAFVPGRPPGAVDVMFAYLEGRRLLGGPLGFRLGRQYVTDVLGWWSFDGLELDAATPVFLRVQVYSGFEQRGGLALGGSRFESDGVWRGSRDGMLPSQYPSFQAESPAPALGAAVESAGLPWVHGRLTARRVYNTGPSNVTAFGAGTTPSTTVDGMRVSSDRLGGSLDAAWPKVGAAQSGLVYDLYRGEVTHFYGSVDGHLHPRLHVGVDYDYYVPSFDADSVWNFFGSDPRNDVGVRADASPSDHLSVAAGAKLRVFSVPTLRPDLGDPYDRGSAAPTNGHPFDEGFTGSVRWRSGASSVGLRAAGDFGGEGDRVGADATAERVIETRYILRGRVGLWHWDDRLRSSRSAASLGCVAGLGYRFAPRSQGMVEWEEDMNRLVGQRFRLVFSLTLATGP